MQYTHNSRSCPFGTAPKIVQIYKKILNNMKNKIVLKQFAESTGKCKIINLSEELIFRC